MPYRYCRTALLVQCNSTVANLRLVAALRRDHIPRTPCAPQYMGTWTDRIKGRWQSGDQTKDDNKTDQVSMDMKYFLKHGGGGNKLFSLHVGVLPQVKSEATGEDGDSSELQQALNEREEQIKASDEKMKDLQVWTLYTLEPPLYTLIVNHPILVS